MVKWRSVLTLCFVLAPMALNGGTQVVEREYTVKELTILVNAVYGERPDWMGLYKEEAAAAVAQTFMNRINSDSEWTSSNFEETAQAFHGTEWAGQRHAPAWLMRICIAVLLGEFPDDYANGAMHLRSWADLEAAGQEDLVSQAVWAYWFDGKGLYGFLKDPGDLE